MEYSCVAIFIGVFSPSFEFIACVLQKNCIQMPEWGRMKRVGMWGQGSYTLYVCIRGREKWIEEKLSSEKKYWVIKKSRLPLQNPIILYLKFSLPCLLTGLLWLSCLLQGWCFCKQTWQALKQELQHIEWKMLRMTKADSKLGWISILSNLFSEKEEWTIHISHGRFCTLYTIFGDHKRKTIFDCYAVELWSLANKRRDLCCSLKTQMFSRYFQGQSHSLHMVNLEIEQDKDKLPLKFLFSGQCFSYWNFYQNHTNECVRGVESQTCFRSSWYHI